MFISLLFLVDGAFIRLSDFKNPGTFIEVEARQRMQNTSLSLPAAPDGTISLMVSHMHYTRILTSSSAND